MAGYTEELLVAASNLYYVEDLTQQEVARRLHLSRITVTRMLKQARESGLVQITVKAAMPEMHRLALALEQEWGLSVVRVVASSRDPKVTLSEMGRAGAELLARLLTPGCRVGVAWSRTVSSIVPFVKTPPRPPREVVELAGTYLERGQRYAVSWPLAHRLGVPLKSIPMPVIVRSERARALMMDEPSIRQAFAEAEHVDVAMVGLGEVSASSSLVRCGYLGAAQLRELRDRGVVGEVLMSCYDARGRPVQVSFQDRVVSIGLERLSRLPTVVAMALGPSKLAAIRGALNGGFIHGLVTDRDTAAQLLEDGPQPEWRRSPKRIRRQERRSTADTPEEELV